MSSQDSKPRSAASNSGGVGALQVKWGPRSTRIVMGVLALCVAATPALARLDIDDQGPQLDIGRFAMRITNAGIIGNAFFDKGLSGDPSFEFPRGSGHEALGRAELWVGARGENGSLTVSGGPMLEWRPSVAEDDRVRQAYLGSRGSRTTIDEDGDGRVDEETLNGLDDDGDGEIDEDLDFQGEEMCTATYRDDRREAIDYAYPGGERHAPLGLEVEQKSMAWARAGYQGIAGMRFRITNRSTVVLHEVRLGVYADLDSRLRAAGNGHLDDQVQYVNPAVTVSEGRSVLETDYAKNCFASLGSLLPFVSDREPAKGLPYVAVVGLTHTTDPLGYVTNFAFPGAREAFAAARAPRRDTTFRYSVFAQDLPPRQGGPPILDADRYASMAGEYPEANLDYAHDYSVLVSCGPFATLEPGQSLEFEMAFVVADNPDTLKADLQSALILHHGVMLNRQADTARSGSYSQGATGMNGHEVCYEPPPGLVFNYDPHCPSKFIYEPAYYPLPDRFPPGASAEATYRHGQCVWTDFDCDACTGLDGKETTVRWYLPEPAPPQPLARITAGDRTVKVEWEDLPELLMDARVIPGGAWRFWGYRIYRLDDWRRSSLLPETRRWQTIGTFSVDTSSGAKSLSAVLDASVDFDSIAYERKHHPIGRYRFIDTDVRDGFDYHYVVTSIASRPITIGGTPSTELLESPFRTVFRERVTPQDTSQPDLSLVRVVPNPYRGGAEWDREPVPGDALSRHLDFFGLPRARSTIRIYTLAGDFVASIDHDGTTGDGQASWDLISRNGQDVASGVYLYTVDSDLGHTVGRFVVIR